MVIDVLNGNMESVLVVAPHPDDETLGCGGTIARLVDEGRNVYLITIMCHSEGDLPGREAELKDACNELGITDHEILNTGSKASSIAVRQRDLVGMIERTASLSISNTWPGILLIPADGAFHEEHRITHQVCIAAARRRVRDPGNYPRVVLGYTGPEENWSTTVRHMPLSVDISGQYDKKVRALASYTSQLGATTHARSIAAVEAIDRAAGVRRGTMFAEEFCVYRMEM